MLGVIIVAAVAGSLALAPRRSEAPPVPHTRTGAGTRAAWWRSPAGGLAAVVGLVYLNQVAFTVYVLRVHAGDPGFAARYVPDGWFALAHGPVLDTLARHVPAPALLAPSLFRVNALLELPFVVLALLTAGRWFSPAVGRRVQDLVVLIAVSYTATLCLVEWRFHNPSTAGDLVLRVIAGVVVVAWVRRLSPAADAGPAADSSSSGRTGSLAGLLVFTASAAGLGLVVLFVYDTALLYNLGHLDEQLPLAGIGVLVLAGARSAARRLPDHPSGRGIDAIAATAGWLVVLFAVPALPVRYALGFGARPVAAAGALVIAGVAATRGVTEALARHPGPLRPWLLRMAGVALAALAAAAVAATAAPVPTSHTETHLLVAATAALVTALPLTALLDAAAARDRPASNPATADVADAGAEAAP